MALMQDVKRILQSRFPGAEVHLKKYRPDGGIGGTVIWSGFESQMQIDRQVGLRQALAAELPSEKLADVSFIMTLTPDEETVITVH